MPPRRSRPGRCLALAAAFFVFLAAGLSAERIAVTGDWRSSSGNLVRIAMDGDAVTVTYLSQGNLEARGRWVNESTFCWLFRDTLVYGATVTEPDSMRVVEVQTGDVYTWSRVRTFREK